MSQSDQADDIPKVTERCEFCGARETFTGLKAAREADRWRERHLKDKHPQIADKARL